MDNLGVEPNAIVIPVGGGGLLAGMTTVIQPFKRHMMVIVSLWLHCMPSCALKLHVEKVIRIISHDFGKISPMNMNMIHVNMIHVLQVIVTCMKCMAPCRLWSQKCAPV